MKSIDWLATIRKYLEKRMLISNSR